MSGIWTTLCGTASCSKTRVSRFFQVLSVNQGARSTWHYNTDSEQARFHNTALAKLTELGIAEYFIYPQINWSAKSQAVEAIATDINVGIDTVAFIDDQAFEREEVAHVHPDVLCIDAAEIPAILDRAEFIPRFVTDDASNRRLMYVGDIKRNTVEREYQGPKEEFLATLGLEFTLARATERDLQRAEELTLRTHQLNTTGYTYSYDELKGVYEFGATRPFDCQFDGQVRHVWKDRVVPHRALEGVLDIEIVADVLPCDVARSRLHHDQLRDCAGKGGRREAASGDDPLFII